LQDEKNLKGLWRRCSLDEYQKDEPAWETVLDIDHLNEKESENWVWKGTSVLDLGLWLTRLTLDYIVSSQ
jgi:prolyl oligopeptidase